MERYTSIPTTSADLTTLATQMLAAIASYPGFIEDLLTAKQGNVDTLIAEVATEQADADTKNAAYVSARNVYYAARDLLTSTKTSLSDAAGSLRAHIQEVVAAVTASMDADGLAQFEADCGLAFAEPYLFLGPLAPALTLAQWINGTQALLNWAPSDADDEGHCSADAYLVESSTDGSTYAYEKVVTVTEAYVTVGSNSHYRIKPFGVAGEGSALVIAVADFDPAS